MILERPIDTFVAVIPTSCAEIASLVHESLRRVAGHEIFEVEAMLYDWYAGGGEGQR